MIQRPISIAAVPVFLTFVGLAVVFAMRHDLDWPVVILSVATILIGYGVWRLQRWAYTMYLVVSGAIIVFLTYQFFHFPNLEDFLVLFSVAAFIVGSCVMVHRHIHSPYFNPNLNWGHRDPRYRVNQPINFELNGVSCAGGLYDISKSGCFLELSTELKIGDSLKLNIELAEINFCADAKVVRYARNPGGYGFMFLNLTASQKDLVERVVQRCSSAA